MSAFSSAGNCSCWSIRSRAIFIPSSRSVCHRFRSSRIAARKTPRQAYFGGHFVETAVYERERLAPGACVAGPAIVESPLTTVVIPPGHRAQVDGYRDLVIRTG